MKTHSTHSPTKLAGTAWHYCRRCGLVFLRNDATRRAMAERCKGADGCNGGKS